MTQPFCPSPQRDTHDPETTLRLLATLPPPTGLTDRVHRRLAATQQAPPRSSFWSLWRPARRLQFAGAALLVGAIAVSSWTFVDSRRSRSPVIQTSTPGPGTGPSALTPSGAERHPSSLTPIKVPPAPKKKPSASKPTASRDAKPAAASAAQDPK